MNTQLLAPITPELNTKAIEEKYKLKLLGKDVKVSEVGTKDHYQIIIPGYVVKDEFKELFTRDVFFTVWLTSPKQSKDNPDEFVRFCKLLLEVLGTNTGYTDKIIKFFFANYCYNNCDPDYHNDPEFLNKQLVTSGLSFGAEAVQLGKITRPINFVHPDCFLGLRKLEVGSLYDHLSIRSDTIAHISIENLTETGTLVIENATAFNVLTINECEIGGSIVCTRKKFGVVKEALKNYTYAVNDQIFANSNSLTLHITGVGSTKEEKTEE